MELSQTEQSDGLNHNSLRLVTVLNNVIVINYQLKLRHYSI
jgi:hypothetical protein